MNYHLHNIIPVDINKLNNDTYTIELIGDCLTSERNTFIFLIFLINFEDHSIEKDPLFITNIRKDEEKTVIYDKLISGKTKYNSFFLDWKFTYDEQSGYYYTDLYNKEHDDIRDRLIVSKNMFLQTCIFLSTLNDKENPKVYLNVFSDEEYKNIIKSSPKSEIPSNTFNFIYNDKLYIIFKSDCVRYIEINRRRKDNNDQTTYI